MKVFLFIFFSLPAYSSTCEQYLKTVVDKTVVLPTDKTCKSVEYYYGLNNKKGDEQARNCAYRELEEKNENKFGGAAILSMIYANGRGVKQDIDLAKKYACLFGGDSSEIKGRLERIETLRNMPGGFEICDDISSDFMKGHCNYIVAMDNKAARTKRLLDIEKTFGVDSQKTFNSLKTSFAKYLEAHLRNEIDFSSSAKAKLIEEEEKLQKQFQEKIERFEKNGSPTGFAENEKYLQSLLHAIQARDPKGTVKYAGVAAAQNEWLKFRDEWIKFAAARYPKVSKDLLIKELTEDRVKILEEVKSNY